MFVNVFREPGMVRRLGTAWPRPAWAREPRVTTTTTSGCAAPAWSVRGAGADTPAAGTQEVGHWSLVTGNNDNNERQMRRPWVSSAGPARLEWWRRDVLR